MIYGPQKIPYCLFLISHYERHINALLEDVLLRSLVDCLFAEKLAQEPPPSP